MEHSGLVKMDQEGIAAQLETVSLRAFISIHRHQLCTRTVNQRQMAAFLQLDADITAHIMSPPDNFARSSHLYEVIEKKGDEGIRSFLLALQATGNEHVVEFIGSQFPNLR